MPTVMEFSHPVTDRQISPISTSSIPAGKEARRGRRERVMRDLCYSFVRAGRQSAPTSSPLFHKEEKSRGNGAA